MISLESNNGTEKECDDTFFLVWEAKGRFVAWVRDFSLHGVHTGSASYATFYPG